MRRTLVVILLVLPAVLLVLAVVAFFMLGPGYKWKARAFLNEMQAATTAQELQSWATQQISAANGQPVELDTAPPFLSATSDGPPVHLTVEPAGSSEEAHVLAVWGSGFGHWGLMIGNPTFRPEEDHRRCYCIEWEPGVFVWHEIQ